MSGRKEIIATHRALDHGDTWHVECAGCHKTWEGEDAWANFGRHVDELLAETPKNAKEAIINVLADHLGNPGSHGTWDWYLDVTLNDHGHIVCGCGWTADEPDDINEWRNHMAEAIINELEKIPEGESE